MTFIKEYSGVVALVILAIMGVGSFFSGSQSFGTAVDCGSTTCFTTVGVLTSFQDDGTAIFNGAVTLAGAVTQSGALALTSTFKLGASGTTQSNQVVTTCSMSGNSSVAASSTGYAFCTGVTGVTSSDNVFAAFSTSTATVGLNGDNWFIQSAKASTTAGAIDFVVYNATGKAQALSAASQVGSTTNIWAAH